MNVGDKVRIIGGTKGVVYLWLPEMDKYIGEVHTIIKAFDWPTVNFFELTGIEGYRWEEQWLELIGHERRASGRIRL